MQSADCPAGANCHPYGVSQGPVSDGDADGRELAIEMQLESVREMTGLLLDYEKQCIDKLDLAGAKETRTRIKVLLEKEQEVIKRLVAIRQDKDTTSFTQRYQEVVESFDVCWSQFLQKTVNELAQVEDKVRAEHAKKRQEIIQKFQIQRRNFKASVKLTALKHKIIGLMKLYQYEQAEFQSKKANKLEGEEIKLWQQRVQERRRNAMDLLVKKQGKQFEVLRSKNEDMLFQKLKERDSKFDILLKKNQIKRMEVKKICKQMAKNLSTASLNTKRQP